MKNRNFIKNSIMLLLPISMGIGVLFGTSNKPVEEVSAYNGASLPTTIKLNDPTESTIRNYYSNLNSLSENERKGNNLLKNLKMILSNGQKYYNYDSGDLVWKMYEITDRDWDKSPASSTTYGTYNASTNTITNYQYGSNSTPKNNPYIRAYYMDRNQDNVVKAWDNHNQDATGINREHLWAKAEGFDGNGAAGARGDPMHLVAANGYANNIHSNFFYGYVDKTKSYEDVSNKYSTLGHNLRGTSKTYPSYSQKVFEPQDCDKGDIARAIFYMAARYNNIAGKSASQETFDADNPNLLLTNDLSKWKSSGYTSTATSPGYHGLITDLLEWNRIDKPDAYEIHRNNLLYTNFTNNRNPFIDFPEWADYIWGDKSTYAKPASDTLNGGGTETQSVTMSFTGSTTTNMTGNNDAATVGLDEKSWSVIGDKGGNGNYPGLNKDGQIRLYGSTTNHNIITISNLDGYTIKSATIKYGSSSNNNVKITVGSSEITGSGTDTEKTYTIESDSFSITHNYSGSTQVYILEIEIVYSSSGGSPNVPVTEITLNSSTITTEIGETFSIKPTISPANATVQLVSWSSSNQSVATVNEDGVVTAISDGTATITCSALDGSGITATCQVTVKEPVTLQSLSLSGEYATEFYLNDEFSNTGMIVTAHYSDGSEVDVSDEAECSGFDSTTTDTKTITVSFDGVSTTYTVNVIARPSAKVTEEDAEGYYLVNDASTLTAEDKLMIVGIESGAYYALAPFVSGNNNCKRNDIPTPTNDYFESSAAYLTLGGSAGNWTLFDGTHYLYAAGGTGDKNLLKGAENANDLNAQWSISISDSKATIVTADSTVVKNTIKHNTGSDCFSCYSTQQADIYLYRYEKRSVLREYFASVDLTKALMSVNSILDAACAAKNVTNANWTSVKNLITPFLSDATSNDCKALMFGIAKSSELQGNLLEDFLARYDLITDLYGYDKFITVGDVSRNTGVVRKASINIETNPTAIVVMILATSGLISIGGYFFFRRKKED